jgi:septum formation protein
MAFVNRHVDSDKDVVDTKDPLMMLGLPSPLILGSSSFTRKLILREMNIPFHILVRSISEREIGDRFNDAPESLTHTVALAKMDHLTAEIMAGQCQDELQPTGLSLREGSSGCIVLTGDQVVMCEGQILEKPDSIEQAREFVNSYATAPPSTVQSCILRHLPSGITVHGTDTATVYFQSSIADSNTRLVDRLVGENEPVLSCAGGIMVEHPYVREHIDHIEGTEDSVMGLSKDLVHGLLVELASKLREKE